MSSRGQPEPGWQSAHLLQVGKDLLACRGRAAQRGNLLVDDPEHFRLAQYGSRLDVYYLGSGWEDFWPPGSQPWALLERVLGRALRLGHPVMVMGSLVDHPDPRVSGLIERLTEKFGEPRTGEHPAFVVLEKSELPAGAGG